MTNSCGGDTGDGPYTVVTHEDNGFHYIHRGDEVVSKGYPLCKTANRKCRDMNALEAPIEPTAEELTDHHRRHPKPRGMVEELTAEDPEPSPFEKMVQEERVALVEAGVFSADEMGLEPSEVGMSAALAAPFGTAKAPQTTRMLKVQCCNAHEPYVLRMTRSQIERGLPACGVCGSDMELAQ